MGPVLTERLERLCKGAHAAALDSIHVGQCAPGIERLAAHFHGRAFAPHRHDTYAIGITISGVQAFRYRGVQRHCLRGQCHVLHPDELHDGVAATEDGFAYRILHIQPSLVQQALGGQPLPFVSNPVIDLERLPSELCTAILDAHDQLDELAIVELLVDVATLLGSLASDARVRKLRIDMPALTSVREAIALQPDKPQSSAELERLSGLDRWTLARQFRAAFGISPGRFRTMRQLDRVRREVMGGAKLAEASLDAGFADQSHMTRHFKRAYGLTPARWAALTHCGSAPPMRVSRCTVNWL